MLTRPVVFLNGPPRCGKDTLAEHIANTLPGFKVVKFASILKERTHALYGDASLPHDHFEGTKDAPSPFFLGLTPREAYIAVSEKLMKPLHGSTVFGELLLAQMISESERVKAFVISDSGFFDEAFPIIKQFGADNCLLIRIHAAKRGVSFKGDSRSYLNLPVQSFNLHNDGTKEEFLAKAKLEFGWYFQSMVGGT